MATLAADQFARDDRADDERGERREGGARGEPAAPPRANPTKTTFPVMLATKTWLRAMKLTASTSPATIVSSTNMIGRGPYSSRVHGQVATSWMRAATAVKVAAKSGRRPGG
jgi:hypothetical protein